MNRTTCLALAMAGAAACALSATVHAADDWTTPQTPFAVFGNTYYVGTRGLSALLLTSGEGHILIDGAGPETPDQIARNIRALGFRVEDVRVIVNSHAHFDHAGGIAQLQRLSGAEVLAGAAGAPVLRTGQPDRGDPQYGDLPAMTPVARVRAVADGEVVRVGPLALTMHATPGHARGGATWTWQSAEGGRTAHIVYADSLNAYGAQTFRYSGDPAYPQARADVERSIATVAALPCDILVSAHPEASGLWQRHARRARDGNAAFFDSGACRAYAQRARARLQKVLAEEAGSRQ